MEPLHRGYPPPELSPAEFEQFVKKALDAASITLEDYQSTIRERVSGIDGEYEIDVTVRFTALGANYLTLIECKRHKAPIKREVVQTLWTKMQSVGAQKAMVFATSGYQSGAVEFANSHGIALVTIADGRSSYLTKAASSDVEPIPWKQVPKEIPEVIGWLQRDRAVSLVSEKHGEALRKVIASSEMK